jgi:hypothetical protein
MSKLKKALALVGMTGAVTVTLLGVAAGPASASQNIHLGKYKNSAACEKAKVAKQETIVSDPFSDTYLYCAPRKAGGYNLWWRTR